MASCTVVFGLRRGPVRCRASSLSLCLSRPRRAPSLSLSRGVSFTLSSFSLASCDQRRCATRVGRFAVQYMYGQIGRWIDGRIGPERYRIQNHSASDREAESRCRMVLVCGPDCTTYVFRSFASLQESCGKDGSRSCGTCKLTRAGGGGSLPETTTKVDLHKDRGGRWILN